MEGMTLRDRIRRMVEALPSPTSTVSLSRGDLESLLGHAVEAEPLSDLTVQEVADEVGRAPSTVRGWCNSGELRAYRLNRREWRITREAMREFQRDQQTPPPDISESDDLGSWRDVA